MAAYPYQQRLTAKLACIVSVMLVIGVLWHISEIEQRGAPLNRVNDVDDASNSRSSGSSVSFRGSRKLADKSCLPSVALAPPVLDKKHIGAVADIKRMTADYAHISAFVQSCDFKAKQTSSKTSKTRGIVIPSAGHTMFAHSWVVVTVLRETLGCTLPIEIIYNGKDELDEELALRLQDIEGVTLIDASLTALPPQHRPMQWNQTFRLEKYKHATGYSFKAYALTFATTFDEVLIMDADNVPLLNPELLFESAQYREKGSTFWPDWWQRTKTQTIPFDLDIDPYAYQTFGLEVPWEISDEPMTVTESGTMLMDRVKHADVLEFIWLLNSHPEVTFTWMHGDKDSYQLAFHLANKSAEFAQVTFPPAQAVDARANNMPFYKHTGMVQFDWSGEMAFLHRTSTAKFNPFARSWRHVDFVTAPLSHQQAHVVVNNGDGWMVGQLNTEFGTWCCGLHNPTRDQIERAVKKYVSTKQGCSIHDCTLPVGNTGLPVMAFPPEVAFAQTNATQVLRMLEELYAVMQQVSTSL